MSKFGKNIKKIRNVRGLTQAQLADMLDVSRGVISSYEEGRAEPKIETIMKTAEVFNLTIDALLTSNITVNQLSGFTLPSLTQSLPSATRQFTETKDFPSIFPNNTVFISGNELPPNAYIQQDEIVCGIPNVPVLGKVYLTISKEGFQIGKLTKVLEGQIILNNQTISLSENAGIYEVIGIYSPFKEYSPLEDRITNLEKRIKNLEDLQKS
ncbi:helix-turn-helix domain-containing protein [Mongoliitalea daihaiensis]|uniref:helix-turn-helix domain-containing protein n=1 Tax=Mongoliitalea daihaiensis TaxID=2782006 RepID=UPI001F249D74|nr:helix-turn-helix transcriptional regulator [Mongoliitalea daihaiensis]UJP66058.1 helix-turn-helix transcriptional regulator [Mongoliitalea daihaiensis]